VNLDGYWASYSNTEIPFDYLAIKNDSCIMVDRFNFHEKGIVSNEDDILKITISPDRKIVSKIKLNAPDSILLFDSTSFLRKQNLFPKDYFTYKLINLKTDQLLNTAQIPSTWAAIHLYKNDSIRLRIGDRYASPYDIPLFLPQSHSSIKHFLIFIGENVKLEDYQEIIFHLSAMNINKVTLIVNKNAQHEYEIIQDKYYFSWEDKQDFLRKNKIPLPYPTPIESEQSEKSKRIEKMKRSPINSMQDYLVWRSSIKENESPQLLLINKKMDMENYIHIKNDLYNLQLKKAFNVTTQIK
jgi:hypothetical protein